MKKALFLAFLAFAPLVLLAGCAQSASESAELSGEASALTDIAGHPAEAAILEGLRRGLYDAPSDGLFHPDEPVTGAEFVTALWNLAGRPDADSSALENQVRAASAAALSWMTRNGLLDSAAFASDEPITRQDAMKILYAYNGGVSGPEAMLTGIYDAAFTDSSQIPAGGKPSLYWGFYNVLILEPEPDKIAPFGAVSRGDMAAMLIRYMDDFQSEPPTT